MGGTFWKFLHRIAPVMVMGLFQAIPAGLNIFYKLAVSDGMSFRVLVAYRFIFAAAVVVPLALIFERNRSRITWMVAFQGFLCGLFGAALSQNLFIESMTLTSATFVTSVSNLIPALTFILAVILRLETLGLRKISGIAKVVGTLVGVTGAMVLSLYQGEVINLWPENLKLNIPTNKNGTATSHHHHYNHVLGSILALTGCFTTAIWFIIQAIMSKNYPFKLSSTALMCSSAAFQSTVYAICIERDWYAWRLGWNIRLLTVVYAGTLATALMVTVVTFYMRKMGPLFATSFSPLILVFVALVGSLIFADEKLYSGSLIGSALIIVGLYGVVWGMSKEKKKKKNMVEEAAAAAAGPSPSSRESQESLEIVVETDPHQTAVVFPVLDDAKHVRS